MNFHRQSNPGARTFLSAAMSANFSGFMVSLAPGIWSFFEVCISNLEVSRK